MRLFNLLIHAQLLLGSLILAQQIGQECDSATDAFSCANSQTSLVCNPDPRQPNSIWILSETCSGSSCDASTGTCGDGGGGGTPNPECTNNSDCTATQICDASGACISAPVCPVGSGSAVSQTCTCEPSNQRISTGETCTCRTDADCSGADQVCFSDGTCRVPDDTCDVGALSISPCICRKNNQVLNTGSVCKCVDDSDCLNGEQCDTETGTCGTIPSCSVGSGNAVAATCQCAPLNKVVAQGEMCACTADKDCSGQGQVCMSGGVCQVMDTQCPIGVAVTSPCRCSTNGNQELGTGAICKCAGDGDCVNGQNCNSADGTCGVLVQCPVGSGAGVASSCLCAPDNKVAAAGDDCACKKDADCSNVQQVCMSGGICQIPNMPCEIGAVVTTPCVCTTDGNRLAAVGSVCECSKSSDCMNGEECNTNHGTCGVLPSCAVGAAAAVGSFCKCEPSGKILTVGDKCACEKDSDCTFDGQFCFSGGICKSPNTQCQIGALASAPCLCPTDNQSLSMGSICQCSVSSDCPSGKECRDDGLCGDGSFPQCRPGKIVKSTCFCNIDNVATLLTSGKCKCASDSECTGKDQLCNSSGTCGKPRSCSVGLVAKDVCYCNNSKSGGRKLIEKGVKCPCVQDEDCFSANKVCTTKGANRGLCKPAPTCIVGAKAKKSCWCKTNDEMTLKGDQCPCLDGSDCTGGRACSSGWCTISK
ncbi:hypothetical protein HDU78_002969 [Chytriomyces hyalinus]|nr:hypothetical protein HDU78_002969 [Chytriomyces hyalinus]